MEDNVLSCSCCRSIGNKLSNQFVAFFGSDKEYIIFLLADAIPFVTIKVATFINKYKEEIRTG